MKKKLTWGAVLLVLVSLGIVGYDKFLSYCARNPGDPACPQVEPTPSPTPTPSPSPTGPTPSPSPTPTTEPTPLPTPTPTPTPTPSPSPTPTPGQTACPKVPAPGAEIYLNDKAYGHGFDSTVRVKGDPEFCRLIHGVAIDDCHLEGWPRRSACEIELLHGCPVWEGRCYSTTPAAHECPITFDHFGTAGGPQDDPKTYSYEGWPVECGLQRDAEGKPAAGFFAVAHGRGSVRACKPDWKGCGPWREVDK